jgi:hypothetical protein
VTARSRHRGPGSRFARRAGAIAAAAAVTLTGLVAGAPTATADPTIGSAVTGTRAGGATVTWRPNTVAVSDRVDLADGTTWGLSGDGRPYRWTPGSTAETLVPNPGNLRFSQLVGSGHTVYGLAADRSVWAWGGDTVAANYFMPGEGAGTAGVSTLGNSAFGAGSTTTNPVKVELPEQLYIDIAANKNGGFALSEAGDVYAWGKIPVRFGGDATRDVNYDERNPIPDTPLPGTGNSFDMASIWAGDVSSVPGYDFSTDGYDFAAWGKGGELFKYYGVRLMFTNDQLPKPYLAGGLIDYAPAGITQVNPAPVAVSVEVTSVTFGGVPAAAIARSGSDWVFTAPAMQVCGPQDVIVEWKLGGVQMTTAVYPGAYTITDLCAPTAPTNVTWTMGSTTASVSFTPPVPGQNTAAISFYTVTARPLAGGSTITTTGTTSPITLSGLQPDSQ